jgi:hypothetical protein
VSTIGAEVTPVDGPVLNLRWGSTAEVTEGTATDYGALSFLIAVFAAVLMATEDAETSGAAVMLAWLLLTCPQTRGAILRLTRSMHGGLVAGLERLRGSGGRELVARPYGCSGLLALLGEALVDGPAGALQGAVH